MFGIIGTWFILIGENSFLAWLVFSAAFASFYATGAYLSLTGLIGLIRLWMRR